MYGQGNTRMLTPNCTAMHTLGFSGEEVPVTHTSGDGWHVLATDLPNLATPAGFHIEIDEMRERIGVGGGDTCAFFVPINTDSLQLTEYKSGDWGPQEMTINTTTKTLTVRVKNEEGKLVDLHGADWLFIIKRVC